MHPLLHAGGSRAISQPRWSDSKRGGESRLELATVEVQHPLLDARSSRAIASLRWSDPRRGRREPA